MHQPVDFIADDCPRLPKLLIIGHGRHGKDTAARLFEMFFGLSFASSSEFCAEKAIYPLMSDLYPSWRECYEDRANHRELWFHAIRAYNCRPGPTLTEQILERHDIYVGMRSREEFEKSKHLFDYVVWVDRSGVLPPEANGSMELRPEDAHIFLENNGNVDELADRIFDLKEMHDWLAQESSRLYRKHMLREREKRSENSASDNASDDTSDDTSDHEDHFVKLAIDHATGQVYYDYYISDEQTKIMPAFLRLLADQMEFEDFSEDNTDDLEPVYVPVSQHSVH